MYIIDTLRSCESCEVSNVVLDVKYKKISYKTFIKYMQMLVARVEKKIKHKLPDKFVIMFEG